MSRIINGDTVVHFKGQMYNVISIDAEHTEDGEKVRVLPCTLRREENVRETV